METILLRLARYCFPPLCLLARFCGLFLRLCFFDLRLKTGDLFPPFPTSPLPPACKPSLPTGLTQLPLRDPQELGRPPRYRPLYDSATPPPVTMQQSTVSFKALIFLVHLERFWDFWNSPHNSKWWPHY